MSIRQPSEASFTSVLSSPAIPEAPNPDVLVPTYQQNQQFHHTGVKSQLSPPFSSSAAPILYRSPPVLPLHQQQQEHLQTLANAQDQRRPSTTKSIQKISQHALHVRVLRFAWCGAVLVGERLIYSLMLRRCYWPSDPAWPNDEESSRDQYRIAVVADPQLTDWSSYGQSGVLLRLVQFYTDLFMSRSFDGFHTLHQPDAVLFLGDLLDGGRETVNDQATYFKNVERFHRIFQTAQTAYNVRPIVQYTNQRPPEQDSRSGERDHANLQGNHSNNVDKGAVLTDLERENGRSFYQLAKPVPTTREEREQVRGAGKSLRLYVAGNHDIGIGDTTIPAAVRLYQDEFGPLNYEIDLGHHRLVTLDTLTLNAAKGSPVRVEAQHLLDHVARPDMQDSSPRILFTHVPLYRPPQTYCGAERQTTLSIEQGRGYQYQNLVEAELSQEILEKVQPTMILSGDDHDWCGVAHPTMKSGDSSNRLVDMIPEVTVPTFSFAQGVYQPGLVMLNLYDPRLAHGDPSEIGNASNFTSTATMASTFTYRSCMLPVQLHIYFSYAAFLGITLAWTLIQRYRWLQRRSSSNEYFAIPTTSAHYRTFSHESSPLGHGIDGDGASDVYEDKPADAVHLQIPLSPDSPTFRPAMMPSPSSSCLTSRLYWRCVWLDIWHIASLPIILYVILLFI